MHSRIVFLRWLISNKQYNSANRLKKRFNFLGNVSAYREERIIKFGYLCIEEILNVTKSSVRNQKVLKKCRNKFECLVKEMLFIQELKPSLNVQLDSIRAKLFIGTSA